MAVGCFNVQERLMPHLRALVARRLTDRGLRQERVAEHLGVSQAMVSKYLRLPTRPAPGVPNALVEALVEAAVAEAMTHEARGAVPAFCPVCTAMDAQGVCRADTPLEGIDQCLRHDRPVKRRDQDLVLGRLSAAEARIRQVDLRSLAPAVRMNLAMTLPSPRDTRDVAAFPGRLVELKGRIRAISPPEFGASSHLAGLLMKVRRRRPEVRAVLNVRWSPALRKAAEAVRLRLHHLKRQAGELQVVVPTGGNVDGLVDPGDFGIEPILYLLGPDAATCVDRAITLARQLPAPHARTEGEADA